MEPGLKDDMMSVTLPTDLLVGVMNAAPESKLQQATARLSEFDDQWRGIRRGAAAVATPQVGISQGDVMTPVRPAAASALKDFEGMLLRNMLESTLPSADTGLYGDGIAGSIWRSMAADQFASLYAERGGIGIAGTLSSYVPATAPRTAAQWPYFPAFETVSFAS